MKRILFLLLSILIPSITKSQDLNGKWKGGLPQNDKIFVFTMEADILHQGSEISGKAKYVDPTTNSYVVEKFIGSIENGIVTINEYKVIESNLSPRANFTAWCIKTMNGKIITNKEQNTITIEGTWFSNKIYDVRTKRTSSGRCAPGKFILSKELENLTKVSGVIYDKGSLQGLRANLVFKGEKEVKYCESDQTGNYSIEINSNSNYRIIVNSNNFQKKEEDVFMGKDNIIKNFFLSKVEKIKIEKQPSQIPINQKVRLKNVLFKQSKPEILSESFSELDELYSFILRNSNTRIRIEGHTDRIGDSNKNLILSKERAEAIKKYLVDKGIDSGRIETIGYGDKINICKPECKENRRVEFIIIRK